MAAAVTLRRCPPLADPIWETWTGDLRGYIEAGGTEPLAWCSLRGLNQWTAVNLLAAIDQIDGPLVGAAENLFDEFSKDKDEVAVSRAGRAAHRR